MSYLTDNQLKTLAGIFADAGQVFFALTVVPIIFGVDKSQPYLLTSGLIVTFACWIASLIVTKGEK